MSRLMSRKAQKSLKPRFLRPRWTARSLSELCRSWLMRKRFETPSIEMAVVISCSELLGEVGLEPPERLDRGDEDAHGDHADDGEVAQVPERAAVGQHEVGDAVDRKSTRLNSSH